MPTFADYLVLRDSAIQMIFSGVDGEVDFNFDPSPDIRLDHASGAPILSFRAHSVGAENIRLIVLLRNNTGATKEVLSVPFNGDSMHTIHEVLGLKDEDGDTLVTKNNRIFFRRDGGGGSLFLSDVVVWYKRFVE